MNSVSTNLIPAWGAFEENLRSKGLSPSDIKQAKDELRSFFTNADIPASDRIRKLYNEVMPKDREERIAALKQKVRTFIAGAAKDVIKGSAENIAIIRKNLDSYIDQTLRRFRRLGKAETTNWFFHESALFYEINARKAHEYAVVKEVLEDFSAGRPTSAAMMAKLLAERVIGRDSLAGFQPFSDAARSFALLKRLALLGEEEAKDELCWCYAKDTIGNYSEEKKLGLSQDKRIEGLRQLALSGHARSQYKLGSLCLHSDENLKLSHEQKKQFIREIKSHETGHNFCLQAIIKENQIDGLSLGLEKEQRLKMLHQRAETGDKHALCSLFRIYLNNRMSLREPLNLEPLTQKKRLEGLRPINPALWDAFIAEVYQNNYAGQYVLGLSDRARIDWLEEQALAQDNEVAGRIMAEAYASGEISSLKHTSCPIKIPLDERLRKLHILADKGIKCAQYTLLEYYGKGLWSNTNRMIDDKGHTLKGSIADSKLMPSLINWALSGNELGAQKEIDRIVNNSDKSRMLHLLYALNDAMKMS
jgi:hypothetical protein